NWQWGMFRNPGTNGSSDGLHNGDGIFFRTDFNFKIKVTDITDGTSNQFLIGEDIPDLNRWCSWAHANHANGTCAIPPNFSNYSERNPWDWGNSYSFRSRHPGGLQFALADGSVRFVRDTIPLLTYRAMCTIRGGEVPAPLD